MRILLLVSDGYSVYRKGGRLKIKTERGENGYPLSHLSAIMLVGSGSITTEAIGMLSKAGVNLCLLSKNFRLKGLFVPEENISSVVERRLLQYELWKGSRLEVAKRIVRLKAQAIAEEFQLDLSGPMGLIERARDLQELMGYEGLVSRFMFESLSRQLPIFKERAYRPPTDPVNAVLSFVYTLCYQTSYALILSLGFEPYLSFLHTRRGKHASFASDLMEGARPMLTKLVMELFLSEKLNKRHFEDKKLKPEGLSIVLEAYTELLDMCVDKLQESLYKIFTEEECHEACGL